MEDNSNVYLMENQSEEVIAHAFAKTSRSSEPFSTMVKELNEIKSSAFHEKWVLKFGHSSVSEHAVLHLAIEGASRVAIEALESCRIASYTEQSTRYQPMSPNNVYRSEKWSSDFLKDYDRCIDRLFNLYDILTKNTKQRGEFKSPYDVARFALPIATKANVGITINARSLRRTLCKMLASNHHEIINLAKEIQSVAMTRVPTLLKYVSPCNSALILDKIKPNIIEGIKTNSRAPFSVRLIRHNIDLDNIAKYLFYDIADNEFGGFDVSREIIDTVLREQEWHDATYRALEMGTMELEIESDYGSYYDIKRHRMATLIPQKNMGHDGYVMPFCQFMKESGIDGEYKNTMNEVFDIFSRWETNPDAIYMLPNAARRRYVMKLDPKQSFVLIKLRGLHPEGHSSYRTIGLKLFEMCKMKWPELYKWLDKFNENKVSSYELERDYELVLPK